MSFQETRSRRAFLATTGAGLTAGLAGCSALTGGGTEQMKIGLIAPLSGPFSLAAKEMDRGAKFAQADVNENGGVLGQDMELIVKDNQSKPNVAAQVARELVQEENVHGIVGTVSSGSRNAAFDVITSEIPFMYPVSYEGGQCHQNFFGLGAIPNQSVANSIPYMMEQHGSDVYWLGADFAYPRALLPMMKDIVKGAGGNMVGEQFAPITTTQWGSAINNIRSADPDFIYAPIPGGAGISFVKQMHNNGLLQDIPVVSQTFDEGEVSSIEPEIASAGLHSTLDYFMSVPYDVNQQYLERYRSKYGENAVTFSINVNTYSGVRLLASAANEAGTIETTNAIVSAAEEVNVATPKGKVSIEPSNHHLVTDTHIGHVSQDSYPTFEIENTWKQTVPKIEGCSL